MKEFDRALSMLESHLLGHLFKEVWLDIELLYGRIPLGKGSICVLDLIIPDLPYEARHDLIAQRVGILMHLPQLPEHDVFGLNHTKNGMELWESTKCANQQLGVLMWEGVVAKKAGSKYPFQLSNPKREFPHWMKHRHS